MASVLSLHASGSSLHSSLGIMRSSGSILSCSAEALSSSGDHSYHDITTTQSDGHFSPNPFANWVAPRSITPGYGDSLHNSGSIPFTFPSLPMQTFTFPSEPSVPVSSPTVKQKSPVSITISDDHSFVDCTTPTEEFARLELCSTPTSKTYSERVLKYPTAMSFFNESKNRYNNILPNEETLVSLDSNPHAYINANYIFSPEEYISTQAPMPNTFDDFWNMVWEKKVPVVVMLANLIEKGSNKADQYWEDWPVTSTHPQIFGSISVKMISVAEHGEYIQRTFNISSGSESRIVHQLHYTKWPDFGVPKKTKGIINMMNHVNTLCTNLKELGIAGPIVMHCSAGVGRSGTLIAIHHLMKKIRQNETYSVPNTVYEMRKFRDGMVQTVEQYKFIYTVLDYFKEIMH